MTDAASRDAIRAALGGRLRVLREIGRGRLGPVFKAEIQPGQTVAIRILRSDLVDAVGKQRLLREIALVERLNHPNILPILDTGESAGVLYYVTPFLTGESLRARLDREKQLPVADAVAIGQDVAAALAYAHAHNVIHRDINPANVFLLPSGHAVVEDFLIARALAVIQEGARLADISVDTPAYMSPEQMAGRTDIGPQSDVYSLGCLLYEMLAGEPPFTGPTELIAARVAFDPPPLLRTVRPKISPELEQAILTALEKAPADRFGSPTKFIEALRQGVPPTLASPPLAYSRAPCGLGAVALALIALGALVLAPALHDGGFLVVLVLASIVAVTSAAVLIRRTKERAGAPAKPTTFTDFRDRIGRALNYRYRVEDEVGRGGMAVVYRASDLNYPRRIVALKVLRPELAASIESERFLLEIEIVAQLTHPAIVALFDSGDADGLPFYVMPFIEGGSLRQRILRNGHLSIGDTKDIVRNIAGALDHAHRKGVVHRDIKPENVLLVDGHASITDFGIALALDTARKRVTQRGFSPGTPEYMSPEQLWRPASVDHRTDLYSCGCVWFEMLAGRPPYTGDPQAVAAQHLNAPIPLVRSVRPDAPEAMEAAICRLLSKDKTERFQSGSEVIAALG